MSNKIKFLVLSFFRTFNKFTAGRAFNSIIFSIVKQASLFFLFRHPMVKSIFLRGSLVHGGFIPFYSDMDVIIELKNPPKGSLYRSLNSFILYFERFIKKINPFIKDYWQTMILETETEIFRKFWYIYRMNEWRPVGKSKSLLGGSRLLPANAKLLAISTWEAESTWCRRSIERFSNKSYSKRDFLLSCSLVNSYSWSLNLYLRARSDFIEDNNIPPLKKDNFHAAGFIRSAEMLEGKRQKAEALAQAILKTEEDALRVLERYNCAQNLSFCETGFLRDRDSKLPAPLSVSELDNFAMVYKPTGINPGADEVDNFCFVLRDGARHSDIVNALLKLDTWSGSGVFRYELYTSAFYSLNFEPFAKSLVYAKENLKSTNAPHFVRERFVLRSLSFSLQLKLALKEKGDGKLVSLFWQLLKAKVFFSENILYVMRDTIIDFCRKNRGLFIGYDNSFWKILDGCSTSRKEVFDISQRLKEDIFSFLKTEEYK